jgi:hypothetical protein
LRYALENFSTLSQVAEFLKAPSRRYTYSHNMFLWDPQTAIVLENNISTGPQHLREIRTATSTLNDTALWDIPDAIAAVNSFVLRGNHDHHAWSGNASRWNSIRNEILARGDTVTFEDVRAIATFHTGTAFPGSQEDGNVYHSGTQQILLFRPADMHVEVFFRPKTGGLPREPRFNQIDILF